MKSITIIIVHYFLIVWVILVVYLMVTMMLNAMSVCLSIWVLHVHHTDMTRSVPTWVKIIIVHYLARGLCVSLNSHRRDKNVNKSVCSERGGTHRVKTMWSNRIQSFDGNTIASTPPPCRRRRTVHDRSTQVKHQDQSTSTDNLEDIHLHTADIHVNDNTQCELYYEMENSELFRRAQALESGDVIQVQTQQHDMLNTNTDHSTYQPEIGSPSRSMFSSSSITEFPLKWTDIARVMDRLFFIVVFLSMIVVCTFTLCLPYFVSFG